MRLPQPSKVNEHAQQGRPGQDSKPPAGSKIQAADGDVPAGELHRTVAPRRSPVRAGAWRDQNPATRHDQGIRPGRLSAGRDVGACGRERGRSRPERGAAGIHRRRGGCPKTWRGALSELRLDTAKKMKSCAAQSNVLLSQSVTTSIPRKRVDRQGADVDFFPWKPHRSGAVLLAQSMRSHMQSSQRLSPKACVSGAMRPQACAYMLLCMGLRSPMLTPEPCCTHPQTRLKCSAKSQVTAHGCGSPP